MKLWTSFVRNKGKAFENSQGTAAIEMALISPVFFLLFLGIFEVAMVMLVKTSLETAIIQVTRFGRTGQNSSQMAIGLATQYSFGLVNPANMKLTITPYPSYSGINLSTLPDSGTQNFGTSNQVVVYTLSYDWTFFTPLVGNLLGTDGKVTLRASDVVMNEPF